MKTEKQHKKIVDEVHKLNLDYLKQIETLKIELKEARDLSKVIEKLTGYTTDILDKLGTYATAGSSYISANLPDNVLVYVDDILGGKVIKQEGNKCLVIEKDGSVKTGLTKQSNDKGYAYKLVRNQPHHPLRDNHANKSNKKLHSRNYKRIDRGLPLTLKDNYIKNGMNITEFKEDEIITRVKPTSEIGDRSYMGDKLIFVGIKAGKIVLIRDTEYDRGIVELGTDWWSDGWDYYPQDLMDKALQKLKLMF